MGWRFTLRKSKAYTPKRPVNSFNRKGYARTPSNLRGLHRAVDLPGPIGTIKQTPAKSRIIWKGRFGDLGLVIEIQILEGYDKGRYLRYCHCESYTSKPIGTVLPAGYAIARIGMTGNTRGPHDHEELGRYALRAHRDPRWDLTARLQEAFDEGRW